MFSLRKFFLVIVILVISLGLIAQERSAERIAREHLETGTLAFNDRDFPVAVENLTIALRMFREQNSDLTPFNDEIRDSLFRLYATGVNSSNWELATRYGEEFLQIDPSNEAIVRNLATIYRARMNNMSNAIAVWVRYDEQFNSFVAKQEIADLYARNNDNANAIIWYYQALEMNQDADLLQKLASLYMNSNQSDRAIQVYNDFIASEPSRRQLGIAYRNMGRLYQDMNNLPLAIQNYERALEIDFDRSISLWLVDQYYDSGNFERANHHIDIMLRRNQNDNDAIYFRAVMLHSDGRFAEARPLFQRLVNHATYGQTAQQFIRSIDSEN
ncbi:MAG: tetratricopeptide repeat protein [Candidatus Cloacimonetes bacterium]|nr:tetratricopeptide repeat protein [Candidatus Cloacimonadota bacterium]